jgi:arginyl-tRNA synthetase
MFMRDKILDLVKGSLSQLAQARGVDPASLPPFAIERPKQDGHGDFATNAAMVLARFFPVNGKPNSRALAEEIVKHVSDPEGILASPPEIAGPGYLNFRLSGDVWLRVLEEVNTKGAAFGNGPKKSAPIVNLEFVSANPTGPMHVGHGRGAAFGDSLARIMTAAGYPVTREFYINDRGVQAQLLGQSVHIRYKELLGESVTPPPDKNGKPQWYLGGYVKDIAQDFRQRYGDAFAGRDYAEKIPEFRVFGIEAMLARIREDLAAFGVSFDLYSSELAIYQRGDVEGVLQELSARDLTFTTPDGALWLKTPGDKARKKDEPEKSESGDKPEDEANTQDGRVLKKANGDLTYFASDIAYHRDKYQRGFTHLIDVWGADHHGYIPRMKEAVIALGQPASSFEALLVQFVTLASKQYESQDEAPGEGPKPEAKAKRMGKRSGNFVTLRELVDEVGRDATRFFFLMRSAHSPLEFDMDLAKVEGKDNPAIHAQYGHARACSILRRAKEEFGRKVPAFSLEIARSLTLPEEAALLRLVQSFPDVVAGAADSREPHRIISYTSELSQAFQHYYSYTGKALREYVLPQKSHTSAEHWSASWDWQKTDARLLLTDAVRQTLANALALVGISAPERMAKLESVTEEDSE